MKSLLAVLFFLLIIIIGIILALPLVILIGGRKTEVFFSNLIETFFKMMDK